MNRQHDGFGGPPAPVDTQPVKQDRAFEVTCDDVDDDRLLCGEKATTLIVMDASVDDVSPWFVCAYCDEHAEAAALEADQCMGEGEYVIISLNQPASPAVPDPAP